MKTDGITVNPHTYSGIASIMVDRRGANTIACAGGANNLVREKELAQFKNLLPQTKVVLLELGIPDRNCFKQPEKLKLIIAC